MEFNIEYNKTKSENLKTLDDYNIVFNKQIQNYLPIYNLFFTLNENNYNNITLNTNYSIESFDERINFNNFKCTLKNNKNDKFEKKLVFIKYSPLLDPVRYMTGKYNLTSDLFNLPKLNTECHKKINNPYNSAYVDGFFSYLSSKMLRNHDFFNGIEYYGSFLCNQRDYKVNVFDDVEYLIESPFFHKNKDNLFIIDDSFYEEIEDDNSRSKKKKLEIKNNVSLKLNTYDNAIYDEIFEKPEDRKSTRLNSSH